MRNEHKLHKIALAVSIGIACNAYPIYAQEEQEDETELEEVVVTGERLQGSAQAVIEERKNQAFVADILGSEQLSRTGDSDAASALRRVTGLTLVDGKFIYVRGLGERYSSARLNGASIPSPDLTRNVVPLDIFPSSIIESLSVQKAYSPSMPAAFGGGAIDIRTKSVPSEFTAGIEIGYSDDSSAGSGFVYDRDESGLSTVLQQAIPVYRGDFSPSAIVSELGLLSNENQTAGEQAIAINQDLLRELPRTINLRQESLDPNYGVKAFIGDVFDVFDGEFGVLASVSYDSSWDFSDRTTAVIAETVTEDCSTTLNSAEEVSSSCYNTIRNEGVTTESERLNAVVNLGYRMDGHNLTWSNIYLTDNEDESRVSILEAPAASTIFTIFGNDQARRSHTFMYEERKLSVSQLIGQHTFTEFEGIGVDWQYTRSKAETDIPVDMDYRFTDNFTNGQYANSFVTGDDNRAIYSYTQMEDNVDSYSGNLTWPIYTSDYEIELKAGYDMTDRARNYGTSSFGVNAGGISFMVDNGGNPLNNTDYLTDQLIAAEGMTIQFNEPTSPNADDYIAAQKISALYGAFDVIYQGKWRLSGGMRWEDFRQTSIGTSSLIFTQEDLDVFYDPDRIQGGTLVEDDHFAALSFTYIGGQDYQVRFGYGETVVRPDLREVVPVSYRDPRTDIRTFGRVGLESSPIKNYDLRYEYYGEVGDNFSIAAFYKDIQAPIETILRLGDEDYSATFINGESAEVYGIEAEWMYTLGFIGQNWFTSGNVTLSDSEAVIDPTLAGNLTNTTKRMTGHSEYVVNLQLNYDSDDGQHSGSLVYNVFGERILASGVIGREDAFEQPFHSLDIVYTYYPDFNSNIKVKLQNILDEEQEVTQSDIIVRSNEIGRVISISYSYEF